MRGGNLSPGVYEAQGQNLCVNIWPVFSDCFVVVNTCVRVRIDLVQLIEQIMRDVKLRDPSFISVPPWMK